MLVKETANGLLLAVIVHPSSRRMAIVDMVEDKLAINLTAPPDKGKANKQLIQFLAKELGLSKQALMIAHGEKSRSKIIRVQGIEKQELELRLKHILDQ